MVQEHISSKYAATLTDNTKLSQLKAYIEQYLRDTAYSVEGMTDEKLCDKIYSEMAEYPILTPFLGRDNVEEININASRCVWKYTAGGVFYALIYLFSSRAISGRWDIIAACGQNS